MGEGGEIIDVLLVEGMEAFSRRSCQERSQENRKGELVTCT